MRFILEKQGKRFEYAVLEGNIIVGRDRKADISIPDNDVSRHHMTVMRRQDDVTIRDLGSRNGTFVNNKRITDSKLHPGDIVRMGDLSLFFDDGSPGLEIPQNLGAVNDAAAKMSPSGAPTPPEGNRAPRPDTAPAPTPKSPDPEGPAGEPAQESLMDHARTFYFEHKTPVLAGLGVLAGLLVVLAVVKSFVMTDEKPKKRVMPVERYDKFLDDGVAYFDQWIQSRQNKSALSKAKLHFKKIIGYRPERQTANILIDIVKIWQTSDVSYDDFDWETAKRFLNELINNPNVTPRAKSFAQGKIQWWRHEKVTRNVMAAGDKAYDEQNNEKAFEEYRKLESYPKSRAFSLRKNRIPELKKKIYEHYKNLADARRDNDDWEGAIDPYEKAKAFATDKEVVFLDQAIRACKANITEAEVFDVIQGLVSRGDLDQARARLVQFTPESQNYRQALKLLSVVDMRIALRDGRELFENGDAEAAIKKLSDPLVFNEADALSIRAKAKKVLAAFERARKAYEEARKKIEDMKKPVKITGFESARDAWADVKAVVNEGSVYYRRAEERLDELTNEKIGGFYYDKVHSLLDEGENKAARDFLDLARGYDLSLGTKLIRSWREEASKKYNQAINLRDTDKKKACVLLTWIIDLLRPADSHYYEKARKALGEME